MIPAVCDVVELVALQEEVKTTENEVCKSSYLTFI